MKTALYLLLAWGAPLGIGLAAAGGLVHVPPDDAPPLPPAGEAPPEDAPLPAPPALALPPAPRAPPIASNHRDAPADEDGNATEEPALDLPLPEEQLPVPAEGPELPVEDPLPRLGAEEPAEGAADVADDAPAPVPGLLGAVSEAPPKLQ